MCWRAAVGNGLIPSVVANTPLGLEVEIILLPNPPTPLSVPRAAQVAGAISQCRSSDVYFITAAPHHSRNDELQSNVVGPRPFCCDILTVVAGAKWCCHTPPVPKKRTLRRRFTSEPSIFISKYEKLVLVTQS